MTLLVEGAAVPVLLNDTEAPPRAAANPVLLDDEEVPSTGLYGAVTVGFVGPLALFCNIKSAAPSAYFCHSDSGLSHQLITLFTYYIVYAISAGSVTSLPIIS